MPTTYRRPSNHTYSIAVLDYVKAHGDRSKPEMTGPTLVATMVSTTHKGFESAMRAIEGLVSAGKIVRTNINGFIVLLMPETPATSTPTAK